MANFFSFPWLASCSSSGPPVSAVLELRVVLYGEEKKSGKKNFAQKKIREENMREMKRKIKRAKILYRVDSCCDSKKAISVKKNKPVFIIHDFGRQ